MGDELPMGRNIEMTAFLDSQAHKNAQGEVHMEKNSQQQQLNIEDTDVLYALANSRTFRQYKEMYDSLLRGECLFCNLDKLRYPPIIRRGNWIVKKCDMPYPNCEHHLILVYVGEHITDWKKLSRDDKADFMEIIEDAEKMFDIEGCAVVFRRGAIRRHGGTIRHIHGHIMVVALDENGIPVGELRAYFAKSKAEQEHFLKMVGLFERVRTGNITGTRKGFVVFNSNGNYLTDKLGWRTCSIPNAADFLEVTLEQLQHLCAKSEGLQYYEVLSSAETGTVIMDGPFELKEAA